MAPSGHRSRTSKMSGVPRSQRAISPGTPIEIGPLEATTTSAGSVSAYQEPSSE